jgi:uncharacterized protein (DUF433 family)
MEIPKELEGVLESTEDTLHGVVRFAGTRVPLEVFLDTIADGTSLERFLQGFSPLTREQALAVLNWQRKQAKDTFGLELL